MELLRRHLAPVTESAWKEIDEQASISLKQFLSARKVVDVSEPAGWDKASVSTGRMLLECDKKKDEEFCYGVRQSLPIIEPRVRFTLKKWELDNISRGVKDPDLGALEDAAKKIAFFEESVIYNGLNKAGVTGILDGNKKGVALPKDKGKWHDIIVQSVYKLREAAIDGPYALVLSPELWQGFNYLTSCGCSKKEQLESIIKGPVILSHFLKTGVLISLRGGDFQLTLGSDYVLGYENSTNEEVTLYLTESFTSQVIEPNAAIQIKI